MSDTANLIMQTTALLKTVKKQAINVAMRLKDEDISAIFSSPMGRARETASYTAKSHKLEIQNLDFFILKNEDMPPSWGLLQAR